MASPTKFQQAAEDLADGKHYVGTNSHKCMLISDTPGVPNAADTVVDTTTTTCTVKSTSNALEVATDAGYAKGGEAVAWTSHAQASGTFKAIPSADITWTAVTSIGPFQWAVMYATGDLGTTTTTATRAPLCWWAYTSAPTLGPGEAFTLTFDKVTNGVLTLV